MSFYAGLWVCACVVVAPVSVVASLTWLDRRFGVIVATACSTAVAGFGIVCIMKAAHDAVAP